MKKITHLLGFMIVFSLLLGSTTSIVEAKTRVSKLASYKHTQRTQSKKKNNNVMKFLEKKTRNINQTNKQQSALDNILTTTKNSFDAFLFPFKTLFTYLKK